MDKQFSLFKDMETSQDETGADQHSIKIEIDDIQIDDRLFYYRGQAKHYGAVIQIIDNGKFFLVSDLGQNKLIDRKIIIPGSAHRWVKDNQARL